MDSVAECFKQIPLNFPCLDPASDSTWLSRAVVWFAAPDESEGVQGMRKALALFFAILLSCSIVGIPLVILGTRCWTRIEADFLEEPTKTIDSIALQKLGLSDSISFRFSEILPEEILAKQNRLVETNPKYPILSLEDLNQQKLLPTHHLQIGAVHYYCSPIFTLDRHQAVIALVEIEGKLFPRVFYHSISQGTWRVLPYATKRNSEDNQTEKELIHYGKGKCETDTQLPIPLNCALNALPSEQSPRCPKAHQVIETSLSLLPHLREKDRTFDQLGIQIQPSMLLREGDDSDFIMGGMHVPHPPDPQTNQMPMDENLHPDFSTKVMWRQEIQDYGKIRAKIFPSKDRSLLYLFYEASDGRAFLASADTVQAKITSFGVREALIEMHSMDAPLLEYRQQVPSYHWPKELDKNRYQSTQYINQWNYVRQLPIIQQYYQKQGRAIPCCL